MTKAFGVGIIVAPEVADRIAVADPDGRELRTRKLGRVKAKGFPIPIAAHELYPAHTPSVQDGLAHVWSAAIDSFTEGNWEEAYEMLSQNFSEDDAARCFIRFMDQHKKRPPPTGTARSYLRPRRASEDCARWNVEVQSLMVETESRCGTCYIRSFIGK